MAMQPVASHTALMPHATSGVTETAWLSSRAAYRHRAHEMWAQFHPHPLDHSTRYVCNVRLPRGETRLVLPAPSAPALPLANWLEPTCDSPHSGHEGVQTPDRTQATDQL